MNNQDNEKNYQNVEAEVLGELRKEKIGQPGIALVMLVLFVTIIVALPFINSMITEEDGFIYKLLNKNKVTTSLVEPEDKYLDASELQILSSTTKMIYNNLIVMKDFSITEDSINCIMSSYNNVLTLDSQEYYFEIYSSNKELVSYVKLTGTFDNSEKNVELKNNLSFNSNRSYYGKIVLLKNNDYPDVTLNSDESGIAELKCSNDRETLEYTFENGYLIGIQDIVDVNFKGNDIYQKELGDYKEKANALGTIASVSENSVGFSFKAIIDLNTYHVPASVVDFNYFKLNSEAKIVKYNIEGKGFECK